MMNSALSYSVIGVHGAGKSTAVKNTAEALSERVPVLEYLAVPTLVYKNERRVINARLWSMINAACERAENTGNAYVAGVAHIMRLLFREHVIAPHLRRKGDHEVEIFDRDLILDPAVAAKVYGPTFLRDKKTEELLRLSKLIFQAAQHDGVVHLRVSPEIAQKRIQGRTSEGTSRTNPAIRIGAPTSLHDAYDDVVTHYHLDNPELKVMSIDTSLLSAEEVRDRVTAIIETSCRERGFL